MAKKKSINVALQGGGSHGAFTWGVLDELLTDDRIEISAFSGTSAGAMNAVVCVDGLMRDGKEGARKALANFWWEMSKSYQLSPIQRAPFDVFMGKWNLENSPGFHYFDTLTRLYSPSQLNPMNLNPLLDVLNKCVDFDLVRSCDIIKVFVSATNVETGRVKVFNRKELTGEMVMASSCLPMIFQAVEIDGIPYWDGGFMGNPVLFPFHSETSCTDIVAVQINPIERKGVPTTPLEISNRVNEITFNSSLLRELRSIDFISRLIHEGKLSSDEFRDTHVHIIENQNELMPLGASSKLNMEWSFLTHLRDVGRDTTKLWLKNNYAGIGKRSTVDLREMFEGIGSLHHG